MKNALEKIKILNRQVGNFLNKITTSFWNSNFVVALSTLPFYFLLKISREGIVFVLSYIVFWSLFKCNFFVLYSLEKVRETHTRDKSFNWFFIQFIGVFFLLILSFGLDNLLLFDINRDNFSGVKTNNLFYLIFDFCHYSFMTFTTVGFGEIVPVSRIAKFFSALEVFIGFLFVGYILSGFSAIREGILKDNLFNGINEKDKDGNKK